MENLFCHSWTEKHTEHQEGRYSWDSGMQEDLGTSRGGAWGGVEPLRGVRGCAWEVTKLEEEPAEVTGAIVRATLGGSASRLPPCVLSSPLLVDCRRKPASASHNRICQKGGCGAERQQFNNNWHSLNTLLSMVDLFCHSSEGHAFS